MAIKDKAIAELTNISMQLQDIIVQLQTSDEAFYNSAELASILPAIEGMEWGVGIDPRDGKNKFKAYFRKW